MGERWDREERLMTPPKLYYLAHPVKSDEHYTTEQNLDHTLKIQKLLLEAGIIAFAPWWTYCHSFSSGWDNPEVDMKLMLAADCECVKRFGRIILSGHRLSHGMSLEYQALVEVGGEVVDLIGVPDDNILAHLAFGGVGAEEVISERDPDNPRITHLFRGGKYLGPSFGSDT